MEIRFVGHASFVASLGGLRILADPWYFGGVFNDSWRLVSPAAPVDHGSIDHIYISHEHPDHFHFPTLRSIPSEHRQRVRVLYQAHASPRIKDALLRLGFPRVVELPLERWTRLTDRVEAYCGSSGYIDSFLALRADGECLLDLNDCPMDAARMQHLRQVLGPIDVMFAQFSFANWVGNDADEAGEGERKRAQLRERMDIFRPRVTVPFASFVYFANAENARMNAWVTTPRRLVESGFGGCHFMYPGDVLDTRAGADPGASGRAIDLYDADFGRIAADPSPPSVTAAQLEAAVAKSLARFRKAIPWPLRRGVEDFTVHVTDLDLILHVRPRSGEASLVPAVPGGQPARYRMVSQVAWYTFEHPWGTDTLHNSGMYLEPEWTPGRDNRYFTLMAIASSDAISLDPRRALRSLRFWWAKRGEIVRHFGPA